MIIVNTSSMNNDIVDHGIEEAFKMRLKKHDNKNFRRLLLIIALIGTWFLVILLFCLDRKDWEIEKEHIDLHIKEKMLYQTFDNYIDSVTIIMIKQNDSLDFKSYGTKRRSK